MPEAASVQVFVRFRPLNAREKALGANTEFLKLSEKNVSIEEEGKPHDFTFDGVMPVMIEQEAMYEMVGRPTVRDLMAGYNGTIFAYGQTGAGKSWSMMGKREEPSLAGIIPRCTNEIFELMRRDTGRVSYTLSVSYLEVYREVIRDLLDPMKTNLRVRESPQQGVYVDGLTQEYVQSEVRSSRAPAERLQS